MAATVYPASALPLTRSRVWVLAAGLAAVAFGLFAVRYLVTNSLSLERALVPLYHGDVFARREPAPPLKNPSLDDPSGSDQSKKDAWPAGNAPKSERQNEPGSSEVKTGIAASEQVPPQSQLKANNGLETGAGDKPASQSQSPEQASEQSQPQGTSPKSAAKDQKDSDQQSATGLMDKMKDALSSLMAKMRQNGGAQKSQQESKRSNDGQQATEKASAKNDPNGDSQKNASNQQASQDQSAEGQPQADHRKGPVFTRPQLQSADRQGRHRLAVRRRTPGWR